MQSKLNVTGALLVSLTIREYGASKRDDDASAAVVSANFAEDAQAARVWKTLFPRGSAMDKVKAALRALRNFHYRNTLAYMHDGPRVLSTKNYAEYTQGLRRLSDDLDKAVLLLCSDLADLKEISRKRLGTLFKDSDYPTAETLAQAFKVEARYAPLPVADALLDLGLEPHDADQIRKELEGEMRAMFASANRRLWTDLHERLAATITQLGDGQTGKVHPKTYEGLKSLVDLLPRLNVTNDEQLDALATQLKSMLANIDSGDLRQDGDLRQAMAREASQVFDRMSTFMGLGPAKEFKIAA